MYWPLPISSRITSLYGKVSHKHIHVVPSVSSCRWLCCISSFICVVFSKLFIIVRSRYLFWEHIRYATVASSRLCRTSNVGFLCTLPPWRQDHRIISFGSFTFCRTIVLIWWIDWESELCLHTCDQNTKLDLVCPLHRALMLDYLMLPHYYTTTQPHTHTSTLSHCSTAHIPTWTHIVLKRIRDSLEPMELTVSPRLTLKKTIRYIYTCHENFSV